MTLLIFRVLKDSTKDTRVEGELRYCIQFSNFIRILILLLTSEMERYLRFLINGQAFCNRVIDIAFKGFFDTCLTRLHFVLFSFTCTSVNLK